MKLKDYMYDGSRKFELSKVSTNETSLVSDRKEAEAKMNKNFDKIVDLQKKLYAEKKEGVIFLFQAMDAAGKDGTINAVLSCLSPHGVDEAAFKSPSSIEQSHDYLWRIELCTPAKGNIVIFNRSHYEEVLIYRVKKLWESQAHADRIVPEKQLEVRYKDICNYERYLWNNSVRVVKLFLNVSKKEQALRFLSRIEEPEKNWKFSASDYEERKYWDAYQEAFEIAINKTATKEAPWFVIPADHKWYMRYVVSEIILKTLEEMNPHYPKVTKERLEQFDQYREELEKEVGKLKKKDKKKKDKKKKDKKKKDKKNKDKKNKVEEVIPEAEVTEETAVPEAEIAEETVIPEAEIVEEIVIPEAEITEEKEYTQVVQDAVTENSSHLA